MRRRRPVKGSTGAPRILFVGSSGGHLAQLLALRSWWQETERAWVTFDTPDASAALKDEATVWWAFRPTTRNVPNLLRNAVLAWRVLRQYRPDVIISTGAGAAVPFFYLGRLRRVKTVFIEVYDRIDSATLTGRLVEPVADLMLVQWPDQERLYRRALVVGPVL